MASSRMKADDKRAKILRELIALESNKYCFDCSQRGPTYVNMTIGAYVCTQCSGLLRGLNNPHRVKSVNIATFTPEDMEFLKSRGNDLCRKVWLGLYDRSSSVPEPDPKNSQNLKDFLSKKYDNKRWYVAPSEDLYTEARQANQSAFDRVEKSGGRGGVRGAVPNNNSSKLIIQQPPRTVSNSASTSAPVNPKSTGPQAMQKIDASAFLAGTSSGTSSAPSTSGSATVSGAGTANLLGDLGSDPFGASSASSGAFSADFSSAFSSNPGGSGQTAAPAAVAPSPWGNSTQATPLVPSISGQASSNQAVAPVHGPSGSGLVATNASDKYAALAELDGLFGTGPGSGSAAPSTGSNVFATPQAPPVVNWSGAPGGAGSGGFGGWSSASTMAGTTTGVAWGDASAAATSSVFGGGVNGVQAVSTAPFGVPQGAPAAAVSSWSNGNPFGSGPSGAPNKVSAVPGANPFMANPFASGAGAGPSAGGSWAGMPQGPPQQSPSGAPAQNGWGMMAQAPAASHNPFLGLSNQFQSVHPPTTHPTPLQQQPAGPFGSAPQNTTNPFL